MQDGSGMQKNNQEKLVAEKPIILVGLGNFFGFLGKLFSQSSLWSIFLFILFLLFFISDDFKKVDSILKCNT